MKATSEYLNKPLRSLEQAEWDIAVNRLESSLRRTSEKLHRALDIIDGGLRRRPSNVVNLRAAREAKMPRVERPADTEDGAA